MIKNRLIYCKKRKTKVDMAKRTAWDSFGGRVKFARDAAGMTQDDMVAELKKRGVVVSSAAYSKLETGETKRIHIDYLLAISQIVGVSVGELLTGEVAVPPQFETEEANAAGALIDGMLPRQRRLALQTLTAIAETDRVIQEEMASLTKELENVSVALENGQKKRMSHHIDRILRNNESTHLPAS